MVSDFGFRDGGFSPKKAKPAAVTGPGAAFRFETGAGTDVGKVRKRNEDNYFVEPSLGIWAVADGMGGHEAGDRASETVVNALSTTGRATSAPDLLSRVQDRLLVAHDKMKELQAVRSALVGATVVALLVYERFYACVWSGDSRLYRIRSRKIEQLSSDHSEVQELVDNGVLTKAEAQTWSGRNAITRAVGVHDELEVEVLHGDLRHNDTFVLCSDGLTNHVSDAEILSVAQSNHAEAACGKLIHLALERGGEDNITVIVVRCREVTMRETTVIMHR